MISWHIAPTHRTVIHGDPRWSYCRTPELHCRNARRTLRSRLPLANPRRCQPHSRSGREDLDRAPRPLAKCLKDHAVPRSQRGRRSRGLTERNYSIIYIYIHTYTYPTSQRLHFTGDGHTTPIVEESWGGKRPGFTGPWTCRIYWYTVNKAHQFKTPNMSVLFPNLNSTGMSRQTN